ncbi:hypothetical protein [Algoriphagus sp.]|nr:hypothetical protein [Algoriphagus sp.]
MQDFLNPKPCLAEGAFYFFGNGAWLCAALDLKLKIKGAGTA